MNQPLITIITITYNAASTLRRTMQSIGNQTFRDFEHLIIDGASIDSTLAIASEMRSPGARIVSEPDKGLYDAMNKGLRGARGQYVLFLNSGDTFASSETLQHYASASLAKPDIIYADTVVVDNDGNYLRPRHLSAPGLLTYESFSHGMLVCHQAFMVRKAIAPEYDLRYRFSSDYDWTLKCIRNTTPEKCCNLHSVEIHYLTAGLTDKNHIASLKERFAIMKEHFGLVTAIKRHIGFIPRMMKRRIDNRV